MRFVHPYCGGNSVILRTVAVALVNRAVERNVLPVERGVPLAVHVFINSVYLCGGKTFAVNFNLVQKSRGQLSVYAELYHGVGISADI